MTLLKIEKGEKMNEFYQKHSEWLIPVLCVIVIFQAVMLLGGPAQKAVSTLTGKPVVSQPVVPAAEPVVAQIQLVPQLLKAVRGKPVMVEVWLKLSQTVTLGGIDLVLKFDPVITGITKVEPSKVFSLVIPNRQSEKNGRLFVTYLDEKGSGVVINKSVKLMSLTVTPKLAGKLVLGIVSSTQGATTVLAEKATSQSLPFVANDLTITVSDK